jgi:DNA-binding transcriptional ArsR family regulator
MIPVMIIRDPEAVQLVADETRRKIIFLLRVREMNVSQIATELNLTPQAVYHHIRRLVNCKLVEVVREERIGHLIESYYMSTAELFTFNIGSLSENSKLLTEQMQTILTGLKRLGFDLEFDDAKVSQLAELWQKAKDRRSAKEFEEPIAKLDNIDFLTQQNLLEIAESLKKSEEEFTTQEENRRRFRDLLLSLVKK